MVSNLQLVFLQLICSSSIGIFSVVDGLSVIDVPSVDSVADVHTLSRLSSQYIPIICSWCTPSSQYRQIHNSFFTIRKQYCLPTWTTSFSIYWKLAVSSNWLLYEASCGQYDKLHTSVGYSFKLLKWSSVLFLLPWQHLILLVTLNGFFKILYGPL